MKKKISIALAAFAFALLLVVGSVAGTIAYLTSTTGVVTNTFTVGDVAITLDETKVDVYGDAITGTDAGKTTTGNAYKLIPGHEYKKDPTVHVVANSEQCYVFVKVINGITDIETGSIATQLAANGWVALDGVANVYYYKDGDNAVVDARTDNDGIDLPVIGTFTIKDDATVSGYKTENNANAIISVNAYAVQADGFDDAKDAWTGANFS